MNVQDAAARYISLGWYPIPLRKGKKALRDGENALTRIYEAEEFNPEDNIGLYLVPASDKVRSVKLVAIDFDCPEIDATAVWTFLPKTTGWGRKSKPISQLLYIAPFDKAIKHEDKSKDNRNTAPVLVEIRVKHQSMCPPSTHPNGEKLAWLTEDDITPATVAPEVLHRRVQLLATYAAITRYYNPKGNRHHWGLYLAGFLRTLGINADEAALLFEQAGRRAGDPEVKDRLDAVRNTYARAEDEEQGGANKLLEHLDSGDGPGFILTLRKIWGITDKSTKAPRASVTHKTVLDALAKLEIKLSFDSFANQRLIQNGGPPMALDDDALVHVMLEIEDRFGFRPTKEYFADVLADEARKASFHPVRQYLESLKWDGTPRIDRWLVTYGGAEDSEFVRAVGRIVLLAAVRRARHPGCKFDELLVLESAQGLNKSTALLALCPKPEWFAAGLSLGADAKVMIERTAGRWIIEIGELTGSRREVEHIKDSLSRQVDGPVRLAYGRFPVAVPRQFITIGTTNERHYLKDRTGNRRFWPVPVKLFDVEGIRRDRDQLWAEAALREARGEPIQLEERLWAVAQRHQEDRLVSDPWEPLIEDWLHQTQKGRKQRAVLSQIAKVVGVPVERQDERFSQRVSAIMYRLAFGSTAIRYEGRVVRGWGRDYVGGYTRSGVLEGGRWESVGRAPRLDFEPAGVDEMSADSET